MMSFRTAIEAHAQPLPVPDVVRGSVRQP